MSKVRNLFTDKNEAQRYNSYRPIYHDLPCAHLSRFFKRKIPMVLDVACGTGHSTRALSKISDTVIGCDASEAMLVEANQHSNHEFRLATAEELPFASATFDYLNISMAFMWLDQQRFLTEAKRVLRPGAFLGIDNYGFTGKMVNHEAFTAKYKDFDQIHMKSAPRNRNYPEPETLSMHGFEPSQEFRYDHPIVMNVTQFTNYLMTRSNFLELDSRARESIERKLVEYYTPLFEEREKSLIYSGILKLYYSLPVE